MHVLCPCPTASTYLGHAGIPTPAWHMFVLCRTDFSGMCVLWCWCLSGTHVLWCSESLAHACPLVPVTPGTRVFSGANACLRFTSSQATDHLGHMFCSASTYLAHTCPLVPMTTRHALTLVLVTVQDTCPAVVAPTWDTCVYKCWYTRPCLACWGPGGEEWGFHMHPSCAGLLSSGQGQRQDRTTPCGTWLSSFLSR